MSGRSMGDKVKGKSEFRSTRTKTFVVFKGVITYSLLHFFLATLSIKKKKLHKFPNPIQSLQLKKNAPLRHHQKNEIIYLCFDFDEIWYIYVKLDEKTDFASIFTHF